MELLNRKYSASEVCRATDISVQRLNTWFERDLITGLKGLEGAGKKGRNRRYSFYNVMEIAIAKALIDQGFNVKSAFGAAQIFAHAGGPNGDLPDRAISFPFHHNIGVTYLAAVNGTGKCRIDLQNEGRDVFESMMSDLQRPLSVTIINLSDLFDTVSIRCGFHPLEVLDEVYPEEVTV